MTTQTKPVKLDIEESDSLKARTLRGDVWRQFRKHKLAIGGTIILFIVIFMVLFGPYFWTVSPVDPNLVERYSGMTAGHPFGTDNLGRDTLARCIYGGRVSLAIGVTSMAIAMSLGTLVGILAGYYKRLDSILMRLTDLFLSLPLLPLLLVIMLLFRDSLRTAFGPEMGIFMLTVSVIGMLGWMPTARLVRGEVLSVKEREFVVAARSVGASDLRIVFNHVLPNVLSPVMVAATFSVASAIITESISLFSSSFR